MSKIFVRSICVCEKEEWGRRGEGGRKGGREGGREGGRQEKRMMGEKRKEKEKRE